MPNSYVYPTSAQLRQIEQDFVAQLTADDPLFSLLPPTNTDAWYVMWDQQDNIKGLQQARGMDGSPPRVNPIGAKQYIIEPGIYGEYEEIREREITTRRQYGTFNTPIDLTDIVMTKQQQLLARRYARWRQIGWTLLTTGGYTVLGPTGATVHADTFTLQTFTASPLWSSTGTATPFADLRAIKLLARGHSVDFGAGATLYANSTTINNLLNNQNANDIFGRRNQYGATFNDLASYNNVLKMNMLPTIVDYDDGYYNDAGTFTLFIPNGVAVLVGRRKSGAAIGNLCMARNANNPNSAPGPYTKVVDLGDHIVPRRLEIHDGANIAPVLWFPSSVVALTV